LELTKFLSKNGFRQSKSDYSLFTKASRGLCTFILVYVDDLLITGDDIQTITESKVLLHKAYTIKDLGLARHFLGIKLLGLVLAHSSIRGNTFWTSCLMLV